MIIYDFFDFYSQSIIDTNAKYEWPVNRRSHTCQLYGNIIFMYGGTDGISVFNDLWALSLDTMTWERLYNETK